MGYESISVTPVTPRIGANVEGVTLSKPLSNRQVEELHQALAEHQVLFFRDQPLDVEAHKRFGRYFGELHIHPSTPGPEGHPEIFEPAEHVAALIRRALEYIPQGAAGHQHRLRLWSRGTVAPDRVLQLRGIGRGHQYGAPGTRSAGSAGAGG